MNDAQLFAFESDFVSTLRCVPMAVRFKLDACAIKLSLRQWSRFTRGDRQALLTAPCESPAEVEAYRTELVALIALRAGEPARVLVEALCEQWRDAHTVPTIVAHQAHLVGLAPPSRSQWARLTELQRFVLLKLTRDKHDNLNFAPAMIEFGIAEAQPAQTAGFPRVGFQPSAAVAVPVS